MTAPGPHSQPAVSVPRVDLHPLFTGDRDLIPGELRAYRTWRTQLFPDGRLRLRSTHKHTTWPLPEHGPYEASCVGGTIGGPHETPEPHCQCGLYGWYDPHDSRIVPASVFGAVALTGSVVLGSHGARAAAGRVLAVTTTDPARASMLRAAGYRVLPSVAAVVRAYPPDELGALLPAHVCNVLSCGAYRAHRRILEEQGRAPRGLTAEVGRLAWHTALLGAVSGLRALGLVAGSVGSTALRFTDRTEP